MIVVMGQQNSCKTIGVHSTMHLMHPNGLATITCHPSPSNSQLEPTNSMSNVAVTKKLLCL